MASLKHSKCLICGRRLKAESSQIIGVGPVCQIKAYGRRLDACPVLDLFDRPPSSPDGSTRA